MIVLVRHGPSAHVHAGLVDRDGFLRWRDAYEAAGIDANALPPPDLRALAARAGAIVASDTARATESARLLDGREVITSPLLRELALDPPNIRFIRLPLIAWAFTFALRWLRRAHVTAEEKLRAEAAAKWLSELAATRGVVVAVTHASFREVVAETLIRHGWRCVSRSGRTAHWSAWVFERTVPAT